MNAPELDFDELDKAINNVLTDKEAKKEAQSFSAPVSNKPPLQSLASQPTPQPQPSTSSKISVPVLPPKEDRVQGRPSAATPVVPARKPLKQSTPAVRRGVIDIMSPPSQRVSRQATLKAPIADVQKTPVAPPQTPAPAAISSPRKAEAPEDAAGRALRWPPVKNQPEKEEKPVAGAVQAASQEAFETPKPEVAAAQPAAATSVANEDSFERFDTLSRSGFDDAPEVSEPEAVTKVNLPTLQTPNNPNHEETSPIVQNEQSEPASTSPFLAGAKVEKRPLGAFASAPTEPSSHAAPKALSPTEGMPADPLLEEHYDDTSLPKNEPENEKPLVAEAASAGSHTGIKLDHLLDDGDEQHEPPTKATSSPTPPVSGLHSIPQQYKVQEQKTDTTPRPVFDTSEYHTPLTATAPKKSGKLGMWITLIVIVLLAAAGGVMIYLYGDRLGL